MRYSPKLLSAALGGAIFLTSTTLMGCGGSGGSSSDPSLSELFSISTDSSVVTLSQTVDLDGAKLPEGASIAWTLSPGDLSYLDITDETSPTMYFAVNGDYTVTVSVTAGEDTASKSLDLTVQVPDAYAIEVDGVGANNRPTIHWSPTAGESRVFDGRGRIEGQVYEVEGLIQAVEQYSIVIPGEQESLP